MWQSTNMGKMIIDMTEEDEEQVYQKLLELNDLMEKVVREMRSRSVILK